MCSASSKSSESGVDSAVLSAFAFASSSLVIGDVNGGNPDLTSSPEVLTCSRTFRGAVSLSREAGRALLSAEAPLVDERVCRA